MITGRNRLSAVALMLVASVALVACGSSSATNSSAGSPTTPAGSPTTPAAASSTAGASSAASVQNTVTISGFAFSPASITVPVGTTVTWTNQDSTTHTVTADDGKAFDSGHLANGATFSFMFMTAGTFPYHCAIHASMKATVIVTP